MTGKDDRSLRQLIIDRSDELYESAPCGFIYLSPDGTIVKANKTFLSWIGHSKEEVVENKRFQDLLTIGCRIYYETSISPLLQMQGFVSEIALDLASKTKAPLPILANAVQMKDETGRVALIQCTIFNISDRRSYEKELLASRLRAEQSESRLKFLADAGDLIYRSQNQLELFDALTRFATGRFCDLCTIDLLENDELVRTNESYPFPERFAPSLGKRLPYFSALQPILIEDLKQSSDENKKNLNHAWMIDAIQSFDPQSIIILPIIHAKKQIGLIGIYLTELGRRFDLEDLKLIDEFKNRISAFLEKIELRKEKERAQKELEESHEWFSTTLKSIGDAVIVINVDKTISFLNPIAEDLTGWSHEEAQGKPMSRVFHIFHEVTGKEAFNPVEKVLREGTIVGLENHTQLHRRDGTKIVIEDSAAPIKNANNEIIGVVLVFRDVTEKHFEEKLKQATLIDLQNERDIREKFVATLTHDLRSPLTSIKMNAQLILRKYKNDEILRSGADRIVRNSDRADKMIQDLLDTSRLRAGERIPLEMSLCDLASEIKEPLLDLEMIHGPRFVYQGPSMLQGFWNADALKRTIENLCNNAVKYGAPKSPVTISLTKEGDMVSIAVRNEGNPISQEDQETLFEPYRRTESAQQGGQKGWGLGLTLVKGVVEAHHGNISVTSSLKNGTVFLLSLPIDARL